MKKWIGFFMGAMLLATAPMMAGAAQSEQLLEIPALGISLEFPMDLETLQGTYEPMELGEISPGLGIYYYGGIYYALTEEEIMDYSTRELSDEDRAYIGARVFSTVDFFVFKDSMSFEDVVGMLGMSCDLADAHELGSADGMVFYSYYDPEAADLSSLDPEYAAEYQDLVSAFLEGADHATLTAPMEKGAALVGKVVHFETEDMDGNPVKSEDLFAEHEITLLNVWGTWCPPCKAELGELAKIHERILEQDCAVVGLLEDGDTEEGQEAAAALFEENGTNYVNLKPYDGFETDLEIEAFPTSFYVDREGVILAPPIVGAYIDSYEPMLESLLAERSTESPQEAEEEAEAPATGLVPNEDGVYRVIVTDESGAPVPGVMVQFCSDTQCLMETTDEEGMALFAEAEGSYTVHILKAPAGYASDDTEYAVLETYCDIPITLKAE